MLKVILADDMPIVLSGLKQMIPWNDLDYELIGTALNGQEALDLTVSMQPDVLITDIKMPIMDGLELCKKVNQLVPGVTKIILSSYDEFSFAQTAIQYGVKDYILKPINTEKIEQMLSKLKEISSIKSCRNDSCKIFLNDQYKTMIFEALRTGNSEFLNEFFDIKLLEIIDSRYDTARELCVRLYYLIPEFFSEMSANDDYLTVHSGDSLNRLLEIKTITGMIEYVKNMYMNICDLISSKKASRNDAVISYVKNYVYDNYCKPDLSVDKIADVLGFAPTYLTKLFSKATGDNVSKFISRFRIAKAQELLKDPSITIIDISNMTGYYDSHYFARVFKKSTGLTPSEYRNFIINKEA